MSSRALRLAAVMFLAGCIAAASTRAQSQNLDAGKSPSQLFSGTCTECHKSPRGLLRSVPAGSLPGFLRQHYTTSGQMASVLSAYLIANGAADPHHRGAQPRPGRDARPEEATSPAGQGQADRRGRRPRIAEPPQEAAKPDADGLEPPAERRGGKRLVRPAAAPDVAKPKPDAARSDTASEPSRKDPPRDEKPASDAAKGEDSRLETGKPEVNGPEGAAAAREGGSDAGRVDAPRSTGGGEPPVLRADPVPLVTPAPVGAPPSASAGSPSEATAPAPESVPAAVAPSPAAAPPPSPAATGSPAPPISQ